MLHSRSALAALPDAAMQLRCSGVIMFKETLYQSTKDGRRFVDVLAKQGILAGVKVDEVRSARPAHSLDAG
jgi:fructose-bisphosphate aldolase class 1